MGLVLADTDQLQKKMKSRLSEDLCEELEVGASPE